MTYTCHDFLRCREGDENFLWFRIQHLSSYKSVELDTVGIWELNTGDTYPYGSSGRAGCAACGHQGSSMEPG
jgi:hypothetical protein